MALYLLKNVHVWIILSQIVLEEKILLTKTPILKQMYILAILFCSLYTSNAALKDFAYAGQLIDANWIWAV